VQTLGGGGAPEEPGGEGELQVLGDLTTSDRAALRADLVSLCQRVAATMPSNQPPHPTSRLEILRRYHG
jgi:hypothetical protein